MIYLSAMEPSADVIDLSRRKPSADVVVQAHRHEPVGPSLWPTTRPGSLEARITVENKSHGQKRPARSLVPA